MGQVLRMKLVAKGVDQQDVVARLEAVLRMARAGDLDGVIIVARDRAGVHNCGSSGWYVREREAGFVPALLSVIDLCGPNNNI